MLFFKEHQHHLLKSKINKKIKEQKYFTRLIILPTIKQQQQQKKKV